MFSTRRHPAAPPPPTVTRDIAELAFLLLTEQISTLPVDEQPPAWELVAETLANLTYRAVR